MTGRDRTENGTGVTHDPLCPINQYRGFPDPTGLAAAAVCRCDLIANVREDMLAECIAAVWESSLYDMEKEVIEEILRALQEKP